MKKVSKDRRVRKTRAALEEAFMSLMIEKDINKISVTDITERADVNRGTFYIHYVDIYDLLESVEDRLIEEMRSIFNAENINSENEYENIAGVLENVKKNHGVFHKLISAGMNMGFYEKLKKVIGEYFVHKVAAGLENGNPKLAQYRDYLIDFYLYGVIGLLMKWLNEENADTSEYVTEIIRTIETITISGMRLISE